MVMPMRMEHDETKAADVWSSEDLHAAEEIERHAVVDMVTGMPLAARSRLGVTVASVGGSTVVTASESSSYIFNRILGLGLREPTESRRIEEVVAYARSRSRRFLVHVAPHARPADIERWLHDAGLQRYPRSWCKLMARTETLASPFSKAPATDVSVDYATSANIGDVAALL